jgi:hypothetical protein
VEVSSLKRKVPEPPDNIDPQSFAVFMRQRGYSVTSTRTSVPVGRAYEVRVPQKDLFLLFVTSEICEGSAERRSYTGQACGVFLH